MDKTIDCDNGAVQAGYTKSVLITYKGVDTHLLVKPGTDFTSHFRAFNADMQMMMTVFVFDSMTEID